MPLGHTIKGSFKFHFNNNCLPLSLLLALSLCTLPCFYVVNYPNMSFNNDFFTLANSLLTNGNIFARFSGSGFLFYMYTCTCTLNVYICIIIIFFFLFTY
ncbi:hypothetical protein ACOSQ4_028964 [Xanthoceras sorbifolium]